MTYEYLSAGPPERTGRRLVWPWVVLGVAMATALVAVVAVAGLWVLRNLEMRGLVAAVEVSEAEMTRTQEQVRAAFAPYEGAGALDQEQREQLLAALEQVAADGRDRVASAGARVAGTWVAPWDSAVTEARRAYLAHNQAWVDYLAAAARDPVEFTRSQEDVDRTWQEAEPALRAAVPRPALFDLVARLDLVFADPVEEPEQPQGPTQSVSYRR